MLCTGCGTRWQEGTPGGENSLRFPQTLLLLIGKIRKCKDAWWTVCHVALEEGKVLYER
ncbi:hypothetical protein SAMN00808754_2457 [Thermanaeromonas toyohensis ToBE]|uniref:Uncharacterized protein n=1 Tax=Thermanaeromonas toyohensis ToBE TaxID=698762 RepID=A0A1W1VZD6_9FIRM|nr:hypothetical protein SAMN00808754_2457 [Thermanaeromonas toyohensis ToBE]